MKKTLLLFAMLLSVVGAWAEVTQPETGVYVISGDVNGRRGNLAACTDIPNFPALSNINWPGQNYHNNSIPAITNGEHWYVLKVYNRYVIYNLGLNKYLVKDGNNINFGDTPYLWQILVNGNYNSIYDEVGTYISFGCGTKPSSTKRNVYFNNQSGDGGSWHTFTAVENGENTYAEDIAVVVSKMNPTFTLTDIAGNEYTGTYSGIAGVDEPTFTGVANITISNKQWNGDNFAATITFPFPVSSAEKINPTMISSFKGDSHQADGSFLWYADNGIVKIKKHIEFNNNGRKVASEKNIISYLWALYPKCENGVFSVGIWNIGAGNYISFEQEYDSGKGSTNEAEDVKLENEKMTPFNVAANNAFYHTIKEKEHRLSFGSVNYNSGNLGVYVKNHAGTYNSFHTPAITTQISDAKYSTICLPFAAKLPEGVEAYSIETVNATYATLTSKEGLPANTGAILKAEPGYYTFTQAEEEIDTWDDNLLYGSVEDIYWYGDGYVLSKQDGVVALYKGKLNYILKDGVPEKVTEGGKYFKNNAGKAFLRKPAGSNSRFFLFDFGGNETGIESVEGENGNVKTEVYDLSGRRVQNAKKGIFVINGKVVVK